MLALLMIATSCAADNNNAKPLQQSNNNNNSTDSLATRGKQESNNNNETTVKQTELATLRTEWEKVCKENGALSKQIAQLESQLKTAQEQLATAKLQAQQEKADKEQSLREVTRLTERVTQLTAELTRLKNVASPNDYSYLQNQNTVLKAKHASLDTENKKLHSDNEQLRAGIVSRDKRISTLIDQKQALERRPAQIIYQKVVDTTVEDQLRKQLAAERERIRSKDSAISIFEENARAEAEAKRNAWLTLDKLQHEHNRLLNADVQKELSRVRQERDSLERQQSEEAKAKNRMQRELDSAKEKAIKLHAQLAARPKQGWSGSSVVGVATVCGALGYYFGKNSLRR